MNRLYLRDRDNWSQRKHDEILAEWAKLNGYNVSQSDGAPHKLLKIPLGKYQNRTYVRRYYSTSRFPDEIKTRNKFIDHSSVFYNPVTTNRILLSQPYITKEELASAKAILEAKGFSVYTPPNPFASFWLPGNSMFLIISNTDEPEPKWLKDQLEFKKEYEGN